MVVVECYDIGKSNKSGIDCNDSYNITTYMRDKHNVTLDNNIFDR